MFAQVFTEMTSTIDHYDCSHKQRGYALIFANEDVKPKRRGALEDEMNMEKLFRNLKFDVTHRSDVMAEEIVNLLKKVLAKEEYLKDSDCFAFVISTHGSEIPDGNSYQHQLSCAKNTFITTQKIVNMVSKCKALEGKPKLFFIQACRTRGKIDKNTQVGRDPGHTVLVKKEDSQDESNEAPKHSPAQLSMGHTKDVSSEEETRQKLENLVVNPIKSDGETNSSSAATDEDSKLSSEVKVEIGHSIPDSSLPVDAGQKSASTTTDQASKDPATKKVEIRPFIFPFSCPKDTLIMYAVPPGYIACRQSDGVVWDSSVMLETLKDVLTDIPEDKSLLAALTEVIGRIARDYEYSPVMTDYDIKQLTEEERSETTLYKIVPVINHRLQYDFYFTKKDG